MPGNGVGDRVHNFFAQDNLSQGQHNSPTVDGNWPSLSNNLWPGSQRQVGALNANSKGYNLQQSDSERLVGNPLHGSHGLTFTQANARPEHAKSQTQSQQPNLNGFMYGNQFYQSRQDEGSFLAVDANSNQRNQSQRSISAYGSQQAGGAENQGRPSVRSETSASPVGFDFFGGPQQMNQQQLSMLQNMHSLQSLQHQPSGFSDMQQMQQQAMLMKMQEFQRLQQLQQMDARQQSLVNSPFAKASGSQSPAQMNGSPSYQLPNDAGNPSWMQRNPLAVQGSSNGLVFSPNQGLSQRQVDFVPQQVEQSLYGVPVSGSRGNPSQYPHMAPEKPSVQQLTNTGNFLQGNQLGTFPVQVRSQERSSVGRQSFTAEHGFGQLSGHAVNTAMDVGNVHQFNSMQRNVDMPDTGAIQEQPETLQETADTQIPSGNNVALDPTEERILFGSDDNIWAAFGKSPSVGGEGSSLFDSGGVNAASSLQSGSWSALMQSAVAETSSGDMGVQEEWSGFQTSDVGNQRTLPSNNGGKQHQPLADENLPMTSSFGPGSVPRTSGTSVNKSYQSSLGFQQFGRKSSDENTQGFSKNPAQGLDLLSTQHGRWLNGTPVPKSVAEGSHVHVNVPHSLDGESSGPNQLYSKSNGWNVFGSATAYGDTALTSVQGSERSFQHSENTEHKRMLQREGLDGGTLRKSNSGQDSRVELEQVKSRGNSVTNRDSFSLNKGGVQFDSSNIKAGVASGQFHPNSYQPNYWKNTDPSAQAKGSEVSGGSQQDKIFSGKQEGKGHEMDNSDKQENSTDSYRSNSHHNSAGGQKENTGSDAIDSRGPSTGKQKIYNNHSRKNASSRKFQYHPMGNLDDGEPQTMKQPFFSQGISHFAQSNFLGQLPKNSFEAGKGQSPELQRSMESMSPVNFSRPVPHNSAPFNRSVETFSPDKASQSSQNMLELLHKVDQSKEHAGLVHTFSSDANAAPEALQAENSDGSGGGLQRSQSSNSQGFGLQLGPPMQRAPIGSQSLSSQSSLQMAGSFQPTHIAPEIGRNGQAQLVPSSRQTVPSPIDRSQGESDRSGGSVPTSNETSQHRLPGNFSTFNSGFPHSRGSLQSQEATWASGQLSRSLDKQASMQKDEPRDKPLTTDSTRNSMPDEAGSIPYGNSVSSLAEPNNVNILPGRVVAHQISASRPLSLPFSQPSSSPLLGTPSRPFPNMWSNVPPHQQSLAAEFQKVSSHISQVNQANVTSNTSASLSQVDQDGRHRNFPAELSANTAKSQSNNSGGESLVRDNNFQQGLLENGNLAQKMKESQGKEPVAKASPDGSPANSLSTQRDIEAFGRSLKPNNTFQPNQSLLNQMSPPQNAEDDQSGRPMKRMKGPDNGLGSHHVSSTAPNSNDLNAIVGDALVPRQTTASVDSAMVPENNLEAQHSNLAAQGMFPYSQDGSHGSSMATSSKVDHLKSPQMAPSWFNQYGNFGNGQILSLYDARRGTLVKSAEQPFTYGKSPNSFHSLNSMDLPATANVNSHQVGENRPSAIPSVAADYSSSQVFPSSAIGQQPVILKSKKRKSCTSELDPWHKEVSQDSQSLQAISAAEVDWAKAANRLIDKVGDDIDLLEDGSKMLKAKKRLLLSTHLMQKLLRSPSAAILTSDASSAYEGVAYSVSRLALSDACGMVSLASSKSSPLGDSAKRLPDGCRTSGRVDDQLLVKTVDDFMSRTKMLENEFLRLDKRASVLDLIVECQDLEKFSVINRFAKFHGRGQAENTEAPSSSDAAQKMFPQRYVTALPLPRNLQTANVQCCSL